MHDALIKKQVSRKVFILYKALKSIEEIAFAKCLKWKKEKEPTRQLRVPIRIQRD
jgi:hypothetical protein